MLFIIVMFLIMGESLSAQTDTDLVVFGGVEGNSVNLNPQYLRHFGRKYGRIELAGEVHLTLVEFLTINSQSYRLPGKASPLAISLEQVWDNDGLSVQVGPRLNLVGLPLVGRLPGKVFENLWVGRLARVTGHSHSSWHTYFSGNTVDVRVGKLELTGSVEIRPHFSQESALIETILWLRKTRWQRLSIGTGVHHRDSSTSALIGLKVGIGRLHNHK